MKITESELEILQNEIESLLTGLHAHQCERAKKVAAFHRKDLTSEDLLNPDNFPEIINDPNFMYEDGTAAGILAAKIAIREFLQSKNRGNPSCSNSTRSFARK